MLPNPTRCAPGKVEPTEFCIPDPGRPGRRARGAKKGPYAKKKAWIQREGKLGGPGYTKKSTDERRQILGECVEDYGYRSCLGSVQVLLRNTSIKPETEKVLKSDKKWLVDTFGGPGSFGPRDKKKKKKKTKTS